MSPLVTLNNKGVILVRLVEIVPVSYLLYLFIYLTVFSALDSELLEDKDPVVHLFIFITSAGLLGTNLLLDNMFFE